MMMRHIFPVVFFVLVLRVEKLALTILEGGWAVSSVSFKELCILGSGEVESFESSHFVAVSSTWPNQVGKDTMGNVNDASDKCHCMENWIDSPVVISALVCQGQSLGKQDILIPFHSWQFESLNKRFIGVNEGQVFVLGHLEDVILKIDVVRSDIDFGHHKLLVFVI